METKSAYNRYQIQNIFLGLLCFLFIYMTYAFEIAEAYFTVFLAILGLALTVLPGIFMPCKFVFSSEGVTFKYLFLKNEKYLWENVSEIHVFYGRIIHNYYEIREKCTAGRKHLNPPYIPKSGKTKKLIEEYYKGNIHK